MMKDFEDKMKKHYDGIIGSHQKKVDTLEKQIKDMKK